MHAKDKILYRNLVQFAGHYNTRLDPCEAQEHPDAGGIR